MRGPSASTTSSSSSSSSSAASNEETHSRRSAHVLVLLVPGAQGHTNSMLQFGCRLAYHGVCPTLVTTRYVLSTTARPPPSPFRVAAISDGFNDGGMAVCPDFAEYCRRLESVGSETLAEMLCSETRAQCFGVVTETAEGRPVRVLAAGVAAAAFLSQPCSVDLIYGELWAGRLALPVMDGAELSRRGLLGELGPDDVPTFAAKPDWCPVITQVLLRQFEGLEDADGVLVNSFRDIEPKETDYMERTWRAKAIVPCFPSFFLDDERLPSNKTYGFDLFTTNVSCMAWLDEQTPCSVVLVSYGTVSEYDETQLEELGNGLCNSDKPFLWVVRSNEEHKLSDQLREKCKEHGLIVSWCPQLEVLAHKATGCFFTHCGWNSTLEAIANGMPMVAMTHWADQATISKYMESMWGMGLRVRKDEKGLVTRDEVERCIKEVMDGDRKDEFRRNAAKWMQKAKEAMQKGGSSSKNIAEFAAKYSSC
ncbi:hypothetical protein PVAP13_7KG025400 [Panicum virgatum]|uniref:Glycosyltransferase n=1 Tax=Panicum virgatum TaxID=38727 RepID=A0A8T0Q7W7_PANVG|nr:hypothetical protein PVAP13_7KG025400 [Panicum virgatum]